MNRGEMIDQLERQGSAPWDLVIIGGGATGLGSALDAAARGCRVLLLEQNDFAKGTSSRSTKLIHGGVRYLRQGNLSLVRDSLRERGLIMRNAPGLVRALPFVIPSYWWWESAFYGIGLKVYDLLAGKLGLSRSRHLSRAEVLERCPGIADAGLRGGTLYFDAQFDDARLAIAIARTAAARGGVLINHMPVTSLLKGKDGMISGVAARDAESGDEYEIQARVVVNATGPFADRVRALDQPGAPSAVTLSRGVHVVLDKSFYSSESALMIPETDDGRVLFLIPWHGRVLVGTTDTPCADVSPDPQPGAEEIDYLLDHAGRYLKKQPGSDDARSVFAGLRPLVHRDGKEDKSDTSTLSRDHHIRVSTSGLVTVTGGKWTTYRRMAEDVVDEALRRAGITGRHCRTEGLVLDAGPGAMGGGTRSFVHAALPYEMEDFERAIRDEMARTLEDVLSRRTRCLILDAKAALEVAPAVVERLALALGKDSRWAEAELAAFREIAARYLPRKTRLEEAQTR